MQMPNAAAMINPTVPNLVGVLVGITFLRSIAPLSVFYTAYNIFQYSQGQHVTRPALIALQAWCFAETLFFISFLGYRVYLQAEAVHPPLRSKEERQRWFDKVQGEVKDTGRFMSGWFRGAKVEDIGRKEVRNFLNWSFFEGRATAADHEELEGYVHRSEVMAGVKFKPEGPAKSLRLTIDPVEMDYRSLLWYTIIMALDTIGAIALTAQGYRYYRTPWSGPWVFPPRPHALFAAKVSTSSDLSYWYKPHTSKTKLPVLFLHGVGIGLQAYVEFLGLLDKTLNDKSSDGDIGIMAVEFMPISSRLTNPVPRKAEFVKQLTAILDAHGFEQVVLVNHSYGSIASSHILTDDTLSARISAVLSIDPVTILLHLPDVAYNFTIRKPRLANEWQLWYFASKDPGIAHTLGRHLFWYESVLWRDRVVELVGRGMKFTASLSRRDLIVDTPAVARYLMEDDKPDPIVTNGTAHKELPSKQELEHWKSRSWTGQGLEVLWWDQFDHAQVMDDPAARQQLIDVIDTYCRNEKKTQ